MRFGRSIVHFAGFWLLAGTLGCTTAPAPTRAPGQAITASSQRIYWVGEAAYRSGHYEDAIALWTHALLQLPQTTAADAVRHRLMLRIAHGHLAAFEFNGSDAALEDGYAMIVRYLERHKTLFGEGPAAVAERGDIYALMYEFERRLEPGATDSAAAVTASSPSLPPGERPNVGVAETAQATVVPVRDAAVDTAGENVKADEVRRIRVRTSPDVNDPEVRDKLRSLFYDSEAPNLVLTMGEVAEVHGPRPLLRLGGSIDVVGGDDSAAEVRREARKRGRELIGATRAALLECYQSALGRRFVDHVRPSVEVELSHDGSVSQVAVERGLVDGLGDVCLIETLRRARVSPGAVVSLRVPLSFFVEGTVYVREWNGKSLRTAHEHYAAEPPLTAPPATGRITR